MSALSLSLVITGLNAYTSYNITIKAVSVVGDGQWSQPNSFRTKSTSKYRPLSSILNVVVVSVAQSLAKKVSCNAQYTHCISGTEIKNFAMTELKN